MWPECTYIIYYALLSKFGLELNELAMCKHLTKMLKRVDAD